MALHVGDTAPPGTAWAFNKDIKCVLKQDRGRDDDFAKSDLLIINHGRIDH